VSDFASQVCPLTYPRNLSLDKAGLQHWLDRWVRCRETWELSGELECFDDCFAAPPSVMDSDELAILVFAPGAPRFWKDWFVRPVCSATEQFSADW